MAIAMAHTNRQQLRKSAKKAFTLFELIIVIAILGALMAFIIPMINRLWQGAKRRQAETTLLQMKQAVDLYNLDTGEYPNSLRDLVRPPADENIRSKWLKGGYLPKKQVPTDPWGNKYQFKRTPDGEHPYEMYSYGPSGRKAPQAEWIRVHKI